jgi:hypothetical protein
MKNKPKKYLVRKTDKKTRSSIKRPTELRNRLQYDEQYGYWSYYVDGKEIYDLKEVKINSNKYKVVEADNAEVEYEMGHHSVVHSTKYHIKVPFEKTSVLVDLTQILDRKTRTWERRPRRSRVKVLATKFSTEKPKPAPTRARIR